MFELIESATFGRWLAELRDVRARAKIQARLGRLQIGNPGDVAPVGDGISEMRIHYGPGYRVYFFRQERKVIVVLCGGDKATQSADIEKAKTIARDWKDKTP